DPAAQTWGERRDPWLVQIPCRYGTIYPHGGDLLALDLDGHRMLTKPLLAIPGVRLHQDGDHEKTFVFPPAVFDPVVALLPPRPRRQWTDEERQVQAERLARNLAVPQVNPHFAADAAGEPAAPGASPPRGEIARKCPFQRGQRLRGHPVAGRG